MKPVLNTHALRRIDFFILISIVILMVIGILCIYSSGVTIDQEIFSQEYLKQIIWAITGLGLLIYMSFTNYQNLRSYIVILYSIIIGLLLITLIIGKEVNGARSWLGIGTSFGGQPSEFAKIITIMAFGHYLAANAERINQPLTIMKALAIVMVPMGLILLQPDYGTASVFMPILLTMFFIGGLHIRYLIFAICTAILTLLCAVIPFISEAQGSEALATLLTSTQLLLLIESGGIFILILTIIGSIKQWHPSFYWVRYGVLIVIISLPASFLMRTVVLKDYLVRRLIAFINPEIDPLGAGWNIIQSLTAIGSGEIGGSGFLQGRHSHYRYLPEQSTDFIFSILAEEWGFIGGIVVFLLFLCLIVRGILIVLRTKDPYGSLVAAGITAMFCTHFAINIGTAMGIMPIIGIPLFFLSYGGSSLWTALISVGILISIKIHKA